MSAIEEYKKKLKEDRESRKRTKKDNPKGKKSVVKKQGTKKQSTKKQSSKNTEKKKTTSKKVNNKKASSKKTSNKKKEAIKQKASEGHSTSALVDKLRGKLDNLRGDSGGGPRFNFIKLERGKNYVRFVEPSSGPMVIFYKRHRGRSQGRFRTVTDLAWLLSDSDCTEAMLERDRITDKDIDLVSKYGDPYNVLFEHLNSMGRAEAFSNAQIGQKRSMFVIEKDGEFGVLDMGITFGEGVIDLLEGIPNLFDWEEGTPLLIKATGEGKKRRYGTPSPLIHQAGPLELEFNDEDEEPSTPNLYDVLAGNTLNYVDKVQFLLQSHSKLVDIAAMDIEDFGISGTQLSTSFNFGSNKKKRRIKGTEDDIDDGDFEENEEEEEEEEIDDEDLEPEDEDFDDDEEE